jgi:hypothetical protein
MIAVTAAFAAALVNSHRVSTLGEVSIGPPYAGLLYTGLDIITGDIKIDRNAAIRRSCEATLVDRTGELTPTTAADLLSPLTGNEITLYRGIEYADGSVERVQLGVFGISDAEVSDTPQGVTIKLTGYDRARKVQRASLTDTFSIPSGTNYVTAIHDLIDAGVSGLTYSTSSTSYTTPNIVYGVGDDRWARAQELAAAIGFELYFDNVGVVQIQPILNPQSVPLSWTYDEGVSATVTQLNRKWSDADVYNHYIVLAEGTGVTTPARGEATDTDSSSPTYINGPYGDVVSIVSSPLVTTSGQATDMATSLLYKSLGSADSLTFDAIVNPAHLVGDAIRVNRARLGLATDYIIDSLTIPLEAATAMEAVARTRSAS